MASATTATKAVIGGVDTHKHTHYAAVIDSHGRLLDHREFPAIDRGYADLFAWLHGHGQLGSVASRPVV